MIFLFGNEENCQVLWGVYFLKYLGRFFVPVFSGILRHYLGHGSSCHLMVPQFLFTSFFVEAMHSPSNLVQGSDFNQSRETQVIYFSRSEENTFETCEYHSIFHGCRWVSGTIIAMFHPQELQYNPCKLTLYPGRCQDPIGTVVIIFPSLTGFVQYIILEKMTPLQRLIWSTIRNLYIIPIPICLILFSNSHLAIFLPSTTFVMTFYLFKLNLS